MVEDNDLSSDEGSNIGECLPTASSSPANLKYLKYLLSFIVIWQFIFTISNAAITSLLCFLKWFTAIIGKAFNRSHIAEMGNSIPVTIKSVHHVIGLESDDFINYVVCPSCNSVYEYNDCIDVTRNGQKVSKRCKHIHYPNHPHASQRKPCDALLLSKTRLYSYSN